MKRSLIALLLAVGGLLVHTAVVADLKSDALEGLTPEQTAKFANSAKAFLRAEAKIDRSSNDLGWDCQASARFVELGYDGAKERLAGIADRLLADAVHSKRDGRTIGWAASGATDAVCVAPSGKATQLAQASCEGSRTIYAFQSGLGIACLAKAGALLQRKDLIVAATEAMNHWNRLRMPKVPCPDCVHFATSDSGNDDMRYIRNMNLFIAFGAAELGGATGSDEWKNVARQAAKTDAWERANGNHGYLGKLDPLWTTRPGENERIENHSASVALLLASMGRTLGDAAVGQAGLEVWHDWASCNNKRCEKATCTYWAGDARICQATATAAHCAFRLQAPEAKLQCATYLDNVPSFGSYAMWSVLQARRR